MGGWIQSRSWADCHKFIDEHDDELVCEVLKFHNSDLLLQLAAIARYTATPSCFLFFE